jgi:hypothetical protein
MEAVEAVLRMALVLLLRVVLEAGAILMLLRQLTQAAVAVLVLVSYLAPVLLAALE